MDRTVLYSAHAHTVEPDDFVRFPTTEGEVEGRVIKVEDEDDNLVFWIEDEGQFCDRVPYDVQPFEVVSFLGYGE
jgi:hypothetical protein